MATNRIDSLDPALIRPGRIDRKIEFPLPDNKTKRRIFNIHTGKMTLSDDVNLEEFIMAKARNMNATDPILWLCVHVFVLQVLIVPCSLCPHVKVWRTLISQLLTRGLFAFPMSFVVVHIWPRGYASVGNQRMLVL